jgi:hypothetical protein
MVPLSKAQADTPIMPGPNILSGGVEFASAAIPLEWQQLDYQEYLNLQAYHLVPSTMIDVFDNGYYGWLQLGSFEPLAGAATKVGKAKAAFIVSTPANGLVSTVNTLANGATLGHTVATGGSLAASTTLYYALSFWSNWGESLIGPIATVSTGATANAMITLSWTAPISPNFRKARLYMATSAAALVAGATATVKAEVYQAWTQSWTDYCGTSGVTSTATIPSVNTAYLGRFAGGVFMNGT